jgi:hypothetical protein
MRKTPRKRIFLRFFGNFGRLTLPFPQIGSGMQHREKGEWAVFGGEAPLRAGNFGQIRFIAEL